MHYGMVQNRYPLESIANPSSALVDVLPRSRRFVQRLCKFNRPFGTAALSTFGQFAEVGRDSPTGLDLHSLAKELAEVYR